ncbi:MAG: lysostaphin resistance A-like protein [Candidatus Micrarchaeaceae archaeon]
MATLAIVVLFFGAQTAGGIILSLVPTAQHWSHARANDWLTNSVSAQFAFVAISDGLVLAGIAWLLTLFRWRWQDIGLKWPKLWHIAVGFAAVVPYYVAYIVLVMGLKAFIPALNIDQRQQIGFDTVHGGASLLLTFISLVVIPPIVEEVAMRGFLYTGLRKWLPRVVAALAVSVLFGAAHLMEGGAAGPLWVGAIDTFTLSLVLVSLREMTGNLWAGISLHAAKNGIAFILLYLVAGR